MHADRSTSLRRALWISAVYNLSGAIAFALPSSPLGALAGLPPQAPPIYCALLAMFVALFGGLYAWLAMQPTIVRPMVALAAIGKASAFAIILTLCLMGHAPARGVLTAFGDAVLAGFFAYWLAKTPSPAPQAPA